MVRAAQKSNLASDLGRLTTPMLVLHPRDFALDVQESSHVAAAIPNARLALVDGSNGLGDAAQGLKAIGDFLASLPPRANTGQPSPKSAVGIQAGLSNRELEVLRLISTGKSNAEIAAELVISQNTVIRHVSNIFAKTGASNRAQATAYAKDHGLT
jgi:DNA-binding NarL/FixJ family response regulator